MKAAIAYFVLAVLSLGFFGALQLAVTIGIILGILRLIYGRNSDLSV